MTDSEFLEAMNAEVSGGPSGEPDEVLPPRRQQRTMWLPVPGYALRVNVTVEAKSYLDALSKTILKLLTIRARTSKEIAQTLGLSDTHQDLVISALTRLQDLGLVLQSDERADVFKANGDYHDDTPKTEIRTGRIFFVPYAKAEILPRIYFGEPLPHTLFKPELDQLVSKEYSEVFKAFYNARKSSKASPRKPAALDKDIQKLTRHPDLKTFSGPISAASNKQDEDGFENNELSDDDIALELPQLALDSLTFSHHILAIERDEYARFEEVTLWSQVDLIPRPFGDAMPVFRDPEIFAPPLRPEHLEPMPVSPTSMEEWLQDCPQLQPLLRDVQHHAQVMKEELHEALRILGIDSPEELKAEVESHYTNLLVKADASKKDPFLCNHLSSQLAPMMREAGQFLFVAQKSPDFLNTARNSYASVIEKLAQSLRNQSLPALELWADRWKQSNRTARENEKLLRNQGWAADRMGELSLSASDLNPSYESHLKSALQKPENLYNTIKQARSAGAGTSISLWLLPLFLLESENDEVKKFARPIIRAIELHPLLIRDISKLVDKRNFVFHLQNDATGQTLSDYDSMLYRVWHALENAYALED